MNHSEILLKYKSSWAWLNTAHLCSQLPSLKNICITNSKNLGPSGIQKYGCFTTLKLMTRLTLHEEESEYTNIKKHTDVLALSSITIHFFITF